MPRNQQLIVSVLEDLYRLNPELRDHEANLIPLIHKLIDLRPDVAPDTKFLSALREEVLDKYARRVQPKQSSFMFSKLFKQLAFPVGAVAIAGLLIAISSMLKPDTPQTGTIASLPERSFGSLVAGRVGGLGGGVSSKPLATMAGDDQAKMAFVPPDQMTSIKYVYKGELPSWEKTMDVYRRLKGEAQSSGLAQSFSKATGDMLSLAGNLRLQSFIVNQDQPFGLMFNIDLNESTANINQNYSKWPHPEAACRDDACFQSLRLNESDVPSDEEAIKIANAFLKDNGIPTGKYGAPEINKDWKVFSAKTLDTQLYVPEGVTVIYPLLLNGKNVYEDGGGLHGLSVTVNVRHKRVESVWNLTTNSFQSSGYEMETDQKKINSLIEKGGLYGFYYPEAKKTVEVELANPEIVLQKFWMPKDGSMDELYAPALRFEVTSVPDGIYAPKYILIPLSKDIISQRETPGDVRIMTK